MAVPWPLPASSTSPLSLPTSVNRFTLVAGSIVVLEIVLGAWPVVATSIWGAHAVDTWIHFLYWIRALFLFLAVLQNRWAPWRLAPRQKHPSALERFLGMTASCELGTWVMLSLLVHALLSFILLLLVAVLKHEFHSNAQWALSLAFDAVAILESIGSPMLVGQFAIDEDDALRSTGFRPPPPLPLSPLVNGKPYRNQQQQQQHAPPPLAQKRVRFAFVGAAPPPPLASAAMRRDLRPAGGGAGRRKTDLAAYGL